MGKLIQIGERFVERHSRQRRIVAELGCKRPLPKMIERLMLLQLSANCAFSTATEGAMYS